MINEKIMSRLRTVTEEEKKILKQHGITRDIYMSDDTDTVDAKKLLHSGCLITIRPHTRFVHFPKHTHNYVEVVYMCEGETTQYANGNEIHLSQGELLFLGQGATHEILPAGEGDVAVNFIILPQFFDRVLAMLDENESPVKRFIVDCLGNANGNPSYLYFKVADVLPVENLVENLLWTLISGDKDRQSLNQTTMGLLVMNLLEYTDHLEYKNEKEAAVMQVLHYIDGHYKEGSLSEVAETLHYDLYALSREIKRRTGKNYKELLQEKRLTEASNLLRYTDLSVDSVAESVGYSNMSYFHRIFFERFNVTPKKYRETTSGHKT